MPKGAELAGSKPLSTTGWHLLAATFDGHVTHLYADGVDVASGTAPLARVKPELVIAPSLLPPEEGFSHLGGLVADVTFAPSAAAPEALRRRAATPPDEALLRIEEASKPWPVQVRGQARLSRTAGSRADAGESRPTG